MNKPVLGLVLGGALGVVDGIASMVHGPEVRAMVVSITIGSTIKGLITGLIIGAVARKMRSLPAGLLFGGVVGLLLAFAVAAMPDEAGNHYWWEIMVPGALLGLIVGYATQRYGAEPGAVGAR